MATKKVRFQLRLDEDLYKEIASKADRDTRSTHGEIVHAIRQALVEQDKSLA
jgi:hypothetical protein